MSAEKIDETTNEMLTENGDKEDGTVNNSVSDGEIVEDDDVDDSNLPFLTSTTKVPKNFRSRNDNSESEDEVANGAGKSMKIISISIIFSSFPSKSQRFICK